jgi:cephalosporin-C deacetylase
LARSIGEESLTSKGEPPVANVPALEIPGDFGEFWASTLDEARGHGLGAQFEEDTRRSDERAQVFQVRFTSLERIQVFGWLAVPRTGGRHPAVVNLPGYSMRPNVGVRNMAYEGFAALWVSVRGHDIDSPIRPGFPNYLCHNITDRNRYIYRGAYCDAVLGVDLMNQMDAIDSARIAVAGGSQGGALTIVATALSEGVIACAPDVPFLTNFKYSVAESHSYPYAEIGDMIRHRPDLQDSIWATPDYFDVANFAALVKCPTLAGIGMEDDVCPPAATLDMLSRIGGSVDLKTYPNTGHEHGGLTHQLLKTKWLKDHLGI